MLNKFSLKSFICCLLVFLAYQSSFAQKEAETKKKADSLINISVWRFRAEGKFDEAVKQGIKAVNLSESINYQEGVIRAYLSIANSLIQIGKFSESIRYIDLAYKEINNEDTI